jgi:hypothetical protein
MFLLILNFFLVDFVKIIAPVETRWNSSLMMMRSILQLRPALERVREDFSKATDAKLRGAIPTTEEFDQISAIIGPLTKVEEMSQFFSSDQHVTICHVISKLFNMEGYLFSLISKPSTSEDTKAFCRSLHTKLLKRFPACGTLNKLYAYGAILHPFYRGLTLAQHDGSTSYREMIELMISENEEGPEQDLNQRVVEDETDEEDFSIEAKIRSILLL